MCDPPSQTRTTLLFLRRLVAVTYVSSEPNLLMAKPKTYDSYARFLGLVRFGSR